MQKNTKLDVSEQFLVATRSIPDSDPVLPKAVSTPLLHRLFPVPDPGNGRCRDFATAVQGQESLKQGTNKVKTKYESDQNNFYLFVVDFDEKVVFKMAINVPLVYGLFTVSVPMQYPECTTKVPKSYCGGSKELLKPIARLRIYRRSLYKPGNTVVSV